MLLDFFIVGAQKSGTTSICSILNHHKKIFISTPKEPMFFCRDDVSLHPCFFMERSHEWLHFDWEKDKDNLLVRYESLFRKSSPGVLCGEGSTTYMPSRRVPERISSLNPGAKIIFILRNPVDRAYSAYWHNVYEGSISMTFHNQLRFDGQGILSMGLYKEYIEHYMKYFPREQLYFEVFEEFKSNKQNCIDNILRFLNVDGKIDVTKVHEKTNRAIAPIFHRGQLVLNNLRMNYGARFSAEDQYDVKTHADKSIISRFLNKYLDLLSAYNFRKTKYKKMDGEMRLLLEEYYSRENKNLSALIGIDVNKYWKSY